MDVWPNDAPVFGKTEMETRGQECTNWKEARKYRITSTNVAKVCTSLDFKRTAEEILNPPDLSFNVFINRGKQDEEKGVQFLLKDLNSKGCEAKAYLIGFITHTTYDWLGASPDRLVKVNDEWCLVEVKNWYTTERQKGLKDLRYLDKNNKLRRKHCHYYQIQTALMVSGMKKCYFVVHGNECAIEIIEYDESFCNKLLEILVPFYENQFKKCII